MRLRLRGFTSAGGPLQEWQIGLLFCLAGLAAIIFATAHYFRIQKAIERDTYQPEKQEIWLCSAALFALGLGVAWYVLGA